MENYYNELPEGYELKKEIDATDKKTGIIFNVFALIIMAVLIIGLFFIKNIKIELGEENLGKYYISTVVFLVAMVLYIILHELVHGIAYKALTKQKLTFGITLSCAFCGVPNIYTTRKTSLIALLSPFIVFTIAFGALVILLPNDITGLYASVLFAIHVGGCIGDLYCTWLLLFKLPKDTIINDTGPKQTFYSKITN